MNTMKMVVERSKEKRVFKNNNNNDFRSFLSLLERENDLIRINKTVSSKFEIAAVVSKLERKQAALFENVEDSKISVASNVVGTRKRFSLAIGVNDEKSIHTHIIKSIAKASSPRKLFSASDAPFYENSSNDLKDLPIITHFEKDAGVFITSSIVFSKDQERGNQNSSTHRLLLLGKKHMAIRMVEGRHLHKCYSFAKEHGEDLKVAIAIGVHPAVSIAAAYQAAYGIDEMLIANSLLRDDLTLTKTSYSQLYVPSHAEI